MTKAAVKPVEAERLLDVAARLFRQNGFDGTGLREIAREAGILPGSVHYRFRTKEALLLALMERAVERAIADVRAATADSAEPIERIRLGLRAHLRLLVSGDDSVHVLLYEWRSLKGRAREEMVRLRDRYEAFWDGMLYEAAGSGRLRAGVDLKLVRLFGFGAVNWVATWYSPQAGRSPEEIADAFWAYLVGGLLADHARTAKGDHVAAIGAAPEPRDEDLSNDG